MYFWNWILCGMDEEIATKPLQKKCMMCCKKASVLIKVVPCDHLFHNECLENWFFISKIKNCPVCNTNIDSLNYIKI